MFCPDWECMRVDCSPLLDHAALPPVTSDTEPRHCLDCLVPLRAWWFYCVACVSPVMSECGCLSIGCGLNPQPTTWHVVREHMHLCHRVCTLLVVSTLMNEEVRNVVVLAAGVHDE